MTDLNDEKCLKLKVESYEVDRRASKLRPRNSRSEKQERTCRLCQTADGIVFQFTVHNLLSIDKLWQIRKDDIPRHEKTDDAHTIFSLRDNAWSALIVMRPSYPTTPARIAGITAGVKCCWLKNRHNKGKG